MPVARPFQYAMPHKAPATSPAACETCTKAHLIEALMEQTDLDRLEARRVVEAFFAQIARSLALGEDVKLTGFGSFQTRSKGERPGRNPRTGEVVPVRARRVVTFHASNKLKARLQG